MNIYLIVAALLFSIGLTMVLIKNNIIYILLGVELMLNASNINFVVFSQLNNEITGHVYAIFVIVIAASETAIGLALILQIIKQFGSSDSDKFNLLKEE